MEIRLNSLVPLDQTFQIIKLFGYSTNGLPGLDIVGLGREKLLIREKVIFLMRKAKLKVPLRRYIIGIEGEGQLPARSIQYLELGIFLSYLILSENLRLSKSENCLCSGKLSSSSTIIEPEISLLDLRDIAKISGELIYLTATDNILSEYPSMNLKNMLLLVNGLSFEVESSTRLVGRIIDQKRVLRMQGGRKCIS